MKTLAHCWHNVSNIGRHFSRRTGRAHESLRLGMEDATFERLLTALRRDMFVSGGCFGLGVGLLIGIGAFGALSLILAGAVVWIAWRGWPWEGSHERHTCQER